MSYYISKKMFNTYANMVWDKNCYRGINLPVSPSDTAVLTMSHPHALFNGHYAENRQQLMNTLTGLSLSTSPYMLSVLYFDCTEHLDKDWHYHAHWWRVQDFPNVCFADEAKIDDVIGELRVYHAYVKSLLGKHKSIVTLRYGIDLRECNICYTPPKGFEHVPITWVEGPRYDARFIAPEVLVIIDGIENITSSQISEFLEMKESLSQVGVHLLMLWNTDSEKPSLNARVFQLFDTQVDSMGDQTILENADDGKLSARTVPIDEEDMLDYTDWEAAFQPYKTIARIFT